MNVPVRPNMTAAEADLAALFASAGADLPGGGAVGAVRRDAFSQFQAAGLPHSRMEAWKYTDLKRLMRDAKPLSKASSSTEAGVMLSGLGFRRLVIVDGAFAPGLSDLANLESGLVVRSTREARP